MKYLAIFLVALLVSGCASAYDESRTQTDAFQAWVRGSSECPPHLKDHPDTKKSESHSFSLEQQFFNDNADAQVGFVKGRVRHSSSCRLSAGRAGRRSTTSSSEEAKPKKSEWVPAVREKAVREPETEPKKRSIWVPRARKPATHSSPTESLPGAPLLQEQSPEEPASALQAPARELPRSVLQKEEPTDDCIPQPYGDPLCIK